MFGFRAGLLAAMGLATLPALGCGGTEWEAARRPVSGAVKLDGEPLATGTIGFVPLREGPGAVGQVVDGAYSIPESAGPGLGPYRVEINSIQATNEQVYDPVELQKVDKVKDLVPAEYNADSRLNVEIKADDENSFDFDLKVPKRRPPASTRTRSLQSR
ncbi:hypothetical protein EP7_005215 [Isosphaeraceae bacterium EP7]